MKDDDNLPTAGSIFPEGNRILVNVSPCGTKQTWGRREGNHVVLETFHNVSALVAANRREAIDFDRGANHGDGLKVASVPTAIVQMWDALGFDEADRAKWLNDPDNAAFRTTTGWRV